MFQKNNFDGMVLDSGYMGLRNHHKQIVFLLTNLAQKLHTLSKYLFFVVPPLQGGESRAAFDTSDFKELVSDIDGFSLMTYDFSNSAHPGPSSPLWWFEQNLNIIPKDLHNTRQAKKLFIGLNFYGNDFKIPTGGNPILPQAYIATLSDKKPRKIIWDEEAHEHYFTYMEEGQEHKVYYPTGQYIYDRLQLANKYGASISIWEIGQGLPYFFDFL